MRPPGIAKAVSGCLVRLAECLIAIVHAFEQVVDESAMAFVLSVGFGMDRQVHSPFEELLVCHGCSQ
jgi:hypothetical protein